MKKIIDGKRYNTDTATLLGEASYSNVGDFSHWQEGLYITKSGAYFLAGSGGAASKYSKRIEQNTSSGGENIFPISKPQALEWATEYLSAEQTEELFATEIQDA